MFKLLSASGAICAAMALAIGGLVVLTQVGAKETNPAAVSPVARPSSPAVDVEKAMAERSLGREDAPVTIVEYASMTCHHCADFHNLALPEVKKKLIDTGKARLIFRDCPWDKFALKASMMARCAPADTYFSLVETIFRNQDRWAKHSDPLKGLTELGILAGMDEAYIQVCMSDVELEKAILARMQDAQRNYNVKATPTFLFFKGDERLERLPEFDEVLKKVPHH